MKYTIEGNKVIKKDGKWFDADTGEEVVKITVEETVSEEFFVPKKWEEDDLVSEKYYDGEIILEPGECQSVQYMVTYANGAETSWIEI